MKKVSFALLPFLLALFLTGCGGDKYPRSTPEELGKSVFEAIKNKDKAGLRTLVPAKEDLLASMEELDIPEDEKIEAREGLDKNWEKVQALMENDIFGEFDPMVEELELKFGLETMEMGEVKVEYVENESDTEFMAADIEVDIKFGEEPATIYIKECGKLQSGWVMSPEGFAIK